MAELFSRYTSGIQFTAGVMTGSLVGVSGLNPLVDRLNSIAPNGSQISGTNVTIYAKDGFIVSPGTSMSNQRVWVGSGTSPIIIGSVNANRKSLLIYNNGVSGLFLGTSAVTYANGYMLERNDSYEYRDTEVIYGNCLTGSLDIRYLEVT